MSVAVLQKCLYISNTYVDSYTKSRKLNQDYSVKEGWAVVGLENPTNRKLFYDYRQAPSFYIPRTYLGLPIVAICYRAGDVFNENYNPYDDRTQDAHIYYYEENMLMIQPPRKGFVQYCSDTQGNYLIWDCCLLQYKISANPSLSLLENMANARGYDSTFRYASLGKLTIAYDETKKFYDGKTMRTSTTRDEAGLRVPPTDSILKFQEHRIGKYISSDDSYRYWHKSVDADTRAYFDKYQSVFGWVKRAYGAKDITLPNFTLLTLNGTSVRINVSDPETIPTKWY